MGNGQAVPQQMVGLFQTAFQYRRVCLPFIFLDLGVACVFIVYFVHPLIHQVLSLIPHTAGIALIAILGIALLSDMIVTTSAIVKFNQYLELLNAYHRRITRNFQSDRSRALSECNARTGYAGKFQTKTG